MNLKLKNQFIIAGVILLTAVMLGAFGAHGLKSIVSAKALVTYKTGITYQFYHGFALLLLATLSKVLVIDFSKSYLAFLAGIILFSFNCYLYALTSIKTIAMIIPMGGVLFMIGWLIFIYKIAKAEKI